MLNELLAPYEVGLVSTAVYAWLDEYGYVRNDENHRLYDVYHDMVGLAKRLGFADWERYASAGRDY